MRLERASFRTVVTEITPLPFILARITLKVYPRKLFVVIRDKFLAIYRERFFTLIKNPMNL